MSNVAVLDALLGSDFYYFARKCFHTVVSGKSFVANWHLKAITYQLTQIERGEISLLIVNLPPRSGKSIWVSVAYPAWQLEHEPSLRVIVVSYSNEFGAELHRQARMILESEWYQRLFPMTRLSQDRDSEAVTTVGGGRYATSVGGTLTGRGADLVIIDDPHKADEAQSERLPTFGNGTAARWCRGWTISEPAKSYWSCNACMPTIWPDAFWKREVGLTSSCRRSRPSTRSFRFATVASNSGVVASRWMRNASATINLSR